MVQGNGSDNREGAPMRCTACITMEPLPAMDIVTLACKILLAGTQELANGRSHALAKVDTWQAYGTIPAGTNTPEG